LELNDPARAGHATGTGRIPDGAAARHARLRSFGPALDENRCATGTRRPSNDVDAVAVTSSNALRHASDKLLAALTRKPCFAVGDKTAKQARQAGFASVMSANGDAHRLAALIGDNSTPDARIAYLCGAVRRPEFEAALAQIGRKVVPIETYDTVRLEPTDSAIEQALGAQSVDAVLVYSAESAVVLTIS
jgi:uroporphyrinogen-III synthase